MTAVTTGRPRAMREEAWSPVLPREHGGWASLACLLATVVVATGWDVLAALTVAAALAAFVAKEPLRQLLRPGVARRRPVVLRTWGLALGGLAAGAGLGLAVLSGRWAVLLWGLAGAGVLGLHLFLAARGREHGLASEALGLAGASLAIPALAHARGDLAAPALVLWGVAVSHVLAALLHVRLKIRVQSRTDVAPAVARRFAAAAPALGVVAAGMAAVAGASLTGSVSPVLLLPLVPTLLKVVHGALRWTVRDELSVRRLGWAEVAGHLVFVVLVGVSSTLAGTP